MELLAFIYIQNKIKMALHHCRFPYKKIPEIFLYIKAGCETKLVACRLSLVTLPAPTNKKKRHIGRFAEKIVADEIIRILKTVPIFENNS